MDEMTPFYDFFFNFYLMDINDLFNMNVTQLGEKNEQN
jgi:hypothetical protein